MQWNQDLILIFLKVKQPCVHGFQHLKITSCQVMSYFLSHAMLLMCIFQWKFT